MWRGGAEAQGYRGGSGGGGGGGDKRNIFLGTLGRKGRGSDDEDDDDNDNDRMDNDSMDVDEVTVSKDTKNAAAKWQDLIVEDTLGDAMGSLSKTSFKRSGLHERGVENYLDWKNFKPKRRKLAEGDGDGEIKMDTDGGQGQGQDQSSVSMVTATAAGVVTGQEKVKKPFVPKNPFGRPSRPPPPERNAFGQLIKKNNKLPIIGMPSNNGPPGTGRSNNNNRLPITGRPHTGLPITGRHHHGRPHTGLPITGRHHHGRHNSRMPITGRPHPAGVPITGKPKTKPAAETEIFLAGDEITGLYVVKKPQTGPAITDSTNTGPAFTGSSNTGPAFTGISDTGPTYTGSSNTGSAVAGNSNTGPAVPGSFNSGPVIPGNLDSGSAKTGIPSIEVFKNTEIPKYQFREETSKASTGIWDTNKPLGMLKSSVSGDRSATPAFLAIRQLQNNIGPKRVLVDYSEGGLVEDKDLAEIENNSD